MNDVTSAIAPLQTAITGAVTPAQVMTVIAGFIGISIGFALTWFGAKKLVSIVHKGITKGKMSV